MNGNNYRAMLQFEKMCASGNDFVVIDQRFNNISLLKHEIAQLCDRKYGIGADQLLMLESTNSADVKMRIYNSDGQEAKQCGNGLRAIAKLMLQDSNKVSCLIEVENTLHQCELLQNDQVSVEFPLPVIKEVTAEWLGKQVFYSPAEVNTGNEHLVLWVEDIQKIDVAYHGALIERQYANGINVHFVQRLDSHNVDIRHWERGTGVTLSCGSGSIASAYAGLQLQRLENKITIHTSKEKLNVCFNNQSCTLTGRAQQIYSGQIGLK